MALDPSTRLSTILYTATGVGVFGGVGDPNGVQKGGFGSIYSDFSNGDVYVKTTAFETLTGWNLLGGGGGSGTVTSIGLTGSSIFDFSASSANPITTSGTFNIAFASQLANRVFASPSGVPGVPTFRALTSVDLSLAAAPPANGVQYNDGTNAFTASNGFKFDPASNTVQAGESTVLKGTLQLFAALSAGSVKHTVNNPGGNYTFIWGDSLPANNDLLKVTVSGSNITIASIAASALGFASVNPTSGVLPYNNAGSFADSPLSVTSNAVTLTRSAIGNTSSDGFVLTNPTAASAGAQQFSPRFRLTGQGWKTNAVAASQTVDYIIETQPVQGAASPTVNLVFASQINAGGYNPQMTLRSSQVLSGIATVSSVLYPDATAIVWNNGQNPNIRYNSGSDASAIVFGVNNTDRAALKSIWWSLCSDGIFAWTNSSTVPNTGQDTGLARRQAGYVRVSNASTGIGGLLVGNSTATPIGQTHLINSAVGVEPLYLEAIASTSVPTIRGVISGIQSFAFNPSGKLVGGCNVPTSNQQFSAIGNAKSDVSTIGNVGTGNDNLLAFTIVANALANTGDYAEFDAFGEFAANANNKTLQVVYGGTTIFNTGAVAFNGSNWRLNVKILRTGASAGKSIATFWSNDATTPFQQEIFITTESFTANTTVQFKGEGTSNNDITQLHLESKLCVALTS